MDNSLVLLFLYLACGPVKIENISGQPWNKYDTLTLNRAKVHCGEWDQYTPCVKLFRKKTNNTYNVLCGPQ